MVTNKTAGCEKFYSCITSISQHAAEKERSARAEKQQAANRLGGSTLTE